MENNRQNADAGQTSQSGGANESSQGGVNPGRLEKNLRHYRLQKPGTPGLLRGISVMNTLILIPMTKQQVRYGLRKTRML